ncbi:hypothetical protein H0E87_031018 [Populus deltoides]|uniref:NIF system FeS cluster assembly NifU C-terminal domain-containing protein n=1 Tax=Populus deltoides TaxID=3696 RepID=A0A8T2WLU8_POPDE|nr:hypothetical protein H0E87_031018 [Populus deltoides]
MRKGRQTPLTMNSVPHLVLKNGVSHKKSLYDSNTKAYLPSKRVLPLQENGIVNTGQDTFLSIYIFASVKSIRWSEAQWCFCAGVFHFIEAPEVTAFEMQCLMRDVELFLIGNVLLFIRARNLIALWLGRHFCTGRNNPHLVGAAGGSLELVAIEEPIVEVRLTGPAAGVMTVRVAVTQKLRKKIPAIAAVQLL